MADKRKKKVEEKQNSPEEQKQYSFQDELYRDIMSDEDSAEDAVSPVIGSGKKKKAKGERKKLRPRDIIIIVAAVAIILAIVLSIVIPDVVEEQTSNFASTAISKGSLTLSIKSTGNVSFYNSTAVTAAIAPDVFTFKQQNDVSKKCRYYITECYINNNTKILDLNNEFVFLRAIEIAADTALWQIDNSAEIELKVKDVIGDSVSLDDDIMQYALQNAYVSTVSVMKGGIISGTSTALFTATDYTKALVVCTLSQYEVNNIRLAQASVGGELSTKVTFTSPSGSLVGTLKDISRTPTSGSYFAAYVDLTIPSEETGNAINASNVIGGTVSVSIETGKQTGLIVPLYAIYNDGEKDYILMKRSEASNSTEKIYVDVVLSDGSKSIITSEDERVKNGAVIYYEKEDSLLSSLGI